MPPPKLGDQSQDGGRVFRFSFDPPEHHPGVFAKGSGEAGPGKELLRVAIILGRGSGNDLLKGNGELIGVEGPPLPNLLPWCCYFVPRLHITPSLIPHERVAVNCVASRKRFHYKGLLMASSDQARGGQFLMLKPAPVTSSPKALVIFLKLRHRAKACPISKAAVRRT